MIMRRIYLKYVHFDLIAVYFPAGSHSTSPSNTTCQRFFLNPFMWTTLLVRLETNKMPSSCIQNPRIYWERGVQLMKTSDKFKSTPRENWQVYELKINDRLPLMKMDETYAKSTLGTSQKTCSGGTRGVLECGCWPILFVFNANEIAILAGPTESHVVSTVGRFYDCYGFLAPIMTELKMFSKNFQSKFFWDEVLVLEGGLLEKWKSHIWWITDNYSQMLPGRDLFTSRIVQPTWVLWCFSDRLCHCSLLGNGDP